MDVATEETLARRVIAHIEAGTTDVTTGVQTRPVADYVDPALAERETRALFRRTPAIVASAGRLAEPGDHLAGELHGVPYLLVAQEQGPPRAFVNSCRHRGTRLVPPGEDTAVAAGFTCPWHGWRYDLAGGLCGVPDGARGFPDLPAEPYGLTPLHAEVRHGFVWLTLAGGRDGGVAEHLGELDAELRSYRLDRYLDYGGSVTTGAFNWKLGIEAFLETYHFRWLHPAMKKYVFAPDLSLVDGIGRHVRLVAPKKSILPGRGNSAEAPRLRPHATIAYGLFPGTMLFVEKRHVSVMSIFPAGPERSEVRFLHAVNEDTLRRRAYWDENIGKFLDAADEDFAALTAAQQGFAAQVELARAQGRPEPAVTFGRNEAGLQLFRRAVDEALAADRSDSAGVPR